MTDCPKSRQVLSENPAGTVRDSGTPGSILKKSPNKYLLQTENRGREAIPERKVETAWSRKPEPFLKGPIPVGALRILDGQALKVYLAVRHRADLAGGGAVVVTNSYLATWGVPRSTKSDALRTLEEKGLVVVDRSLGRAPRVTVLR